MTSIYGVVRGKPPRFFDGNPQAFTGLRFHLEGEHFEFYQPLKMKGDPLWIDDTDLMLQGTSGLGAFVTLLSAVPHLSAKVGDYVARLSRLPGVTDVDLHIEEVTGVDKSLDVVVDIFNRVNSGGTKLSKGDLAEYFLEVKAAHNGALASQWNPEDPSLWKMENFREFLEARKVLLAAELNRRMEELLHGDLRWLTGPPAAAATPTGSGINSEEEEAQLQALNTRIESVGLPRGVLAFDLTDAQSGQQRAVFDLAWPNGLQEELSQPVAVLLDEDAATAAVASQAGFRCFTDFGAFRRYVTTEVLAQGLSV